MQKTAQLRHMPRASNPLLFAWKARVEKLREKEGRGSAPFPALAGAGRCLPGPPGHSATPALGAQRLPLPGREAHGVSRGKAAGELLRARAAPGPRRASASRPAQEPGLLRPPRGLQAPRPLPVAVPGVQLRAVPPPPPPTKDKFIFRVPSAAAERLSAGWVPPLPGGCGGGGPRSGKKSFLSSGQRRIISC